MQGFVFVCLCGLLLGLVLGNALTQSTTSNEIPINQQPFASVQIINSTFQNPLRISMQLDPVHKFATWTKSGGAGSLGPPIFGDNTQNPPDYQLITLNQNQTIVVRMPHYATPWRITPLSLGVPITEMPVLVECNQNIVCDMSAVDGVNYLLNMELTAQDPQGRTTTINFNTNPCSEPGKGCLNPYVNGLFADGKDAGSAPCPYGTCNLIEASRDWAQAINTGQCSNVDSTWTTQQGFAPECDATDEHARLFTTYTYSHSDANSSPTLASPYKVKLTYSDL